MNLTTGMTAVTLTLSLIEVAFWIAAAYWFASFKNQQQTENQQEMNE